MMAFSRALRFYRAFDGADTAEQSGMRMAARLFLKLEIFHTLDDFLASADSLSWEKGQKLTDAEICDLWQKHFIGE